MLRCSRKFVFFAILVVTGIWLFGFAGYAAFGQDIQSPSISTDRPTVGLSPDLVPVRSLQFEDGLGATFQRSNFNMDLPESLVRFGVTDRLEVNFLSSDLVYQPSQTPHIARLQTMDPMLGAKIGIGKANGALPRSASVGLSLPMGGSSWTSGSYDPNLVLVWTQAIGKASFLNEVVGSTLTTVGNARRPCWAPSIAGGHSLTDSLGIFAEYAPTAFANRSSNYVIDGGFAVVHRKLKPIRCENRLPERWWRISYIAISRVFLPDGFHPALRRRTLGNTHVLNGACSVTNPLIIHTFREKAIPPGVHFSNHLNPTGNTY